MSAASFLHSSFLQAISAVMFWPVQVQKVPQASLHPCPAKLQTRCDVCCPCQSICLFIPTDLGMPRAVEPLKSLQPNTTWLCTSLGILSQNAPFAADPYNLWDKGKCNLCHVGRLATVLRLWLCLHGWIGSHDSIGTTSYVSPGFLGSWISLKL